MVFSQRVGLALAHDPVLLRCTMCRGLIKRYFTDIRMAEIPGIGTLQNKVSLHRTKIANLGDVASSPTTPRMLVLTCGVAAVQGAGDGEGHVGQHGGQHALQRFARGALRRGRLRQPTVSGPAQRSGDHESAARAEA